MSARKRPRAMENLQGGDAEGTTTKKPKTPKGQKEMTTPPPARPTSATLHAMLGKPETTQPSAKTASSNGKNGSVTAAAPPVTASTSKTTTVKSTKANAVPSKTASSSSSSSSSTATPKAVKSEPEKSKTPQKKASSGGWALLFLVILFITNIATLGLLMQERLEHESALQILKADLQHEIKGLLASERAAAQLHRQAVADLDHTQKQCQAEKTKQATAFEQKLQVVDQKMVFWEEKAIRAARELEAVQKEKNERIRELEEELADYLEDEEEDYDDEEEVIGDDEEEDVKCVDKHAQCELWAQEGECERNATFMLTNCAKSCGNCGM